MGTIMGGDGVVGALLRSVGFYSKSFFFFVVLAAVGFGISSFGPLRADDVPDAASGDPDRTYDLAIRMTESGTFFLGNERLTVETITGEQTYRFRYQVVDRPNQALDQFSVALFLPKPINDQAIGHRFINNGGASVVRSQLLDPQTLLFEAASIGSQAQLTWEIEVPQSYLSITALRALQQRLSDLPPVVWSSVSIALPVLTMLLLLMIAIARNRRAPTEHLGQIDDPPTRLAPALLGILMRGHLNSRDVAATLIDLARRGHLVIRQVSATDFRFSRRAAHDRLEDFEQVLLDQIFGPISDRTDSEEISFTLAQELFSKRISQAFMLAYKKINDLGYFYTNPLRLHRRYQAVGVGLFFIGLVGFFLSLFIFTDAPFFLLFWIGMLISAILIFIFSRGLPSRTVYGDRELARWLVFGRYLASSGPVSFATHSQDKFLAYLPYAIVMETEVEWTKRFYDLPFAQPNWYLAAGITTIDEFANKVFPLFGYVSHTLAITAGPSSR